ncbi:MAG: glutamate synthase subunit beta [Chloroflexi bacterium]|nr:glutamate synthase subunit beta [Chloroflexota bacterium]
MGKPTGFMEYVRELPEDRVPEERVADWNEFRLPFEDEKLQTQAARCMDCGVPFCHTGALLNGMAAGCPLHNLVPEFNDLVYRGLWKQALQRLRRTNSFPEFTGRVCPAPCEGSCCLGAQESPVTIKNIEYAIVERGFMRGWMTPRVPAHRTGKRVAVVGSGPSGLACADQLNQAGHSVTVYERADRPGGLLMYGIPNMKLDKGVVRRRVELMAAEGVQFVTGTEIGVNYPADRLLAEHDAVVLCGGATKPRDLPIEGRDLQGIHFAVDFLRANTQRIMGGQGTGNREQGTGNSEKREERSERAEALSTQHSALSTLTASGKDVVVIGGGDTGTDCVGTSLRHGCRSVVQFEILEKPPESRQPNNPWPEWPRVLKTDYGQEEARALQGQDPRVFCINTTKIVGDERGHVKELHTVQVEWVRGANGRPFPKPIPGTEKVWPAQLVLLCLGFLGPEDTVLGQLAVERDERSNAKTPRDGHATNVAGVFAAGDMRSGQSLVVWAIHEGRAAAKEVDEYLMRA